MGIATLGLSYEGYGDADIDSENRSRINDGND